MDPRCPFLPRPSDTTADAERLQIDLLRAAPVSRRLDVAWSLSARAMTAARHAIARAEAGGSQLDREYLRSWATRLGIADLLDRALTQADAEA